MMDRIHLMLVLLLREVLFAALPVVGWLLLRACKEYVGVGVLLLNFAYGELAFVARMYCT